MKVVRLRNHVGCEVVQFNPVVVAQSTHEAARWRGEAALVVSDEADDVAVRRVGLPIRRRRNNPRRGLPIHVRRQLAAVHELAQGKPRHRRAAPRQRIQHRDWLRASHCGWRRLAETKRALSKNGRAHSVLRQRQEVKGSRC
jgi:hypothetical protein